MCGEGIKKTFQYDTPLTRPQLEKWRQEFWETRTAGSKQVWELLHTACMETPETGICLIEAAGLQLPQNCLTTVIDEAGIYYRVPIACINDPQNFNKNNQLDQLK